MKRSVKLSKDEIEKALREYVQKRDGFTPARITLEHIPRDRPFDPEVWTARAWED